MAKRQKITSRVALEAHKNQNLRHQMLACEATAA